MPFLLLFLVSWAAFFLFANHSKWRRFAPACLLAVAMSLTTDVLIEHYPIWSYYDLSHQPLHPLFRLLDDFGIYPVTTYLFLQYYPPHASSLLRQARYFLCWTTFAISLEFIFCTMGWMVHSSKWSMMASYLADWLIFFVLLRFYLRFHQVAKTFCPLGIRLDFLLERDKMEVVMLTAVPGGVIPPHTHESDEMLVLLRGDLELDIAGEKQAMPHGETVLIKRGVKHAGRNLGDETVLLLSVLTAAGLRERIGLQSYEKAISGETLEL